jgi:hypothetical protein
MPPDGSRGQAPEATRHPVRIGTAMGCLGAADDESAHARRGTELPGTEHPGAELPGAEHPGAQRPSAQRPGAQRPGAQRHCGERHG